MFSGCKQAREGETWVTFPDVLALIQRLSACESVLQSILVLAGSSPEGRKSPTDPGQPAGMGHMPGKPSVSWRDPTRWEIIVSTIISLRKWKR